MFVNIDETFFIKEKIIKKKLQECILFISNQTNIKKLVIKNAYRRNNLKKFNFPKELNKKDIDIIIKTKFNKDYKYVNLHKSKIISNTNKKTKSTIKKIDYFQLNKIKFFPKTYLLRKIIFQNLAKGKIYIPNDLPEFSSNLLKNVAAVVNNLSSRNNSEINISSYLIHNKFDEKVDNLNHKMINIFIKFLKKNHKDRIDLALTHGDFKFGHLFLIKRKLEYVVDWENVGVRSIFFDLMNFFIPWFERRLYNYSQIKKYILNFINIYLPFLKNNINNKYDIYFSIYALERYRRIKEARTSKFDIDEAYKRYNFLFEKLYCGIEKKINSKISRKT